ncbi:MAG TPA: hypothetical protein DC046_11715 [Rhodospirillaceae bacterium]|nr:hypothetical protein [Rhodospirillaceae bacterium]
MTRHPRMDKDGFLMATTRRFLIGSAAFALAFGLFVSTGTAQAKDKWRANNHTDQTVKVLFTAVGCVNIKSDCEGHDVATVCKSHHLKAGEETDYSFPDGTSDRQKIVCSMDANKDYKAWSFDRKENGIRLNADGNVEWYDE